MSPVADASRLNVQPRQRRYVYEVLAKEPNGLSVKDLLAAVEISEIELRQSLRKLDEAGLAMRAGRLWTAVPRESAEPPSALEQVDAK
jgi:hypothetical protein